jgi:hypothetical protein
MAGTVNEKMVSPASMLTSSIKQIPAQVGAECGFNTPYVLINGPNRMLSDQNGLFLIDDRANRLLQADLKREEYWSAGVYQTASGPHDI